MDKRSPNKKVKTAIHANYFYADVPARVTPCQYTLYAAKLGLLTNTVIMFVARIKVPMF